MFLFIKDKVILCLAVLLLILCAVIKFLSWRIGNVISKMNNLKYYNKAMKENHEMDMHRQEFEINQEYNVNAVNDESELNKVDNARNLNDKTKDNNYYNTNI